MRRNQLSNQEMFVVINSVTNDRPPYMIDKSCLDDRRNGNCSDWILHLLDKEWIDNDDLYQLAVIISKECPKSDIDWYQTFFAVEMNNPLYDKGTPLSRTEFENIVREKLKAYNLN